MKIIDSIKNQCLTNDVRLLTKFYQHAYPEFTNTVVDELSNKIQDNSLIIHSGSWRFMNSSGTFVEPKHYQNLNINFPKLVLFVDHLQLLKQITKKYQQVLLIDSILTRYKTVEQIMNIVQEYHVNLTLINLDYLNFNRLTTTYDTVCKQLDGVLVENFVLKTS